MSNPFPYYKHPQNAREHQSNANHFTYERMAANETLRAYDAAGIQAPADVIADTHTARWVEREMIRTAQKARAAEKARP